LRDGWRFVVKLGIRGLGGVGGGLTFGFSLRCPEVLGRVGPWETRRGRGDAFSGGLARESRMEELACSMLVIRRVPQLWHVVREDGWGDLEFMISE
jgi:hypothetical protein